MHAIRRLYDWMGRQVHSKYADPILAFLFFLEAIFFVPTDPMLVLYCLERRDRVFTYAAITTAASVFGGLVSYYIGYWLWFAAGQQIIHSSVLAYFMKPETFTYICEQYRIYEVWAILVAGFTPIPYKAATLTAGFCRLPLIPFIICSIIARGSRFYLVAFTISRWGEHIKYYIDRYFNLLVFLFIVLVMGIAYLIKL